VTFLLDMEDVQELRVFPHWKPHQLTGDRKGTWNLTVTKNWRLTFAVEEAESEISDLNFEDYH
jgi:proteic killer suppression protein